MPSSASPRSSPIPTPKPTGSPPPSTSISCAAPRANTCRWRPREAAAYPYTPADRERIARQSWRLSSAPSDTVRARLDPLIAATKADEVMVTTMIYDHAARRRSYELLAEAFGLSGVGRVKRRV